MDLAALSAVVLAIAACFGLVFQARSVRVSEQQLRSQVETMQTVLYTYFGDSLTSTLKNDSGVGHIC
ncbi:MAG: hypothetical protein EA420_00695 [Candidatus Competibacteraceae bacterium]|nr:MAG: hypothetical protein EA420_00695 [Candidatus Competibacteraceae bacterium]